MSTLPEISLPKTLDVPVIHPDYDVLKELSSGTGSHRTFLAVDKAGDEQVIIKKLRLYNIESWKVAELFERETAVLKQLDHPQIARYLDAFSKEDDQNSPTYFMVQEFVEGRNLLELLDAGQGISLFDEAEARAFLIEVLEVLEYLSSINPPVTHRDITPKNIVRKPDGSYALVGFGAVQAVLPQTMTGSTFVGTAGYVAPEQLMGRAVPASDMFSLGATVIYLLSGTHPGHLPVRRMVIHFEDAVQVSDEFAAIIRKMTAPRVDERFASPREAINAINMLETRPLARNSLPAIPEKLQKYIIPSDSELIIELPEIDPYKYKVWRFMTYSSVAMMFVVWLAVLSTEALLRWALFIGLICGGFCLYLVPMFLIGLSAATAEVPELTEEEINTPPATDEPVRRFDRWSALWGILNSLRPGLQVGGGYYKHTPRIRITRENYYIEEARDDFYIVNGLPERLPPKVIHQGRLSSLHLEADDEFILHKRDEGLQGAMQSKHVQPCTVFKFNDDSAQHTVYARLPKQKADWLMGYMQTYIAKQRRLGTDNES